MDCSILRRILREITRRISLLFYLCTVQYYAEKEHLPQLTISYSCLFHFLPRVNHFMQQFGDRASHFGPYIVNLFLDRKKTKSSSALYSARDNRLNFFKPLQCLDIIQVPYEHYV